MCCGKCKRSHLRHLPFALAMAITVGLAVFAMSAGVMMGYAPPEMAAMHPNLTWAMVGTHVLWAVLKGFVFGFIFAFFYNLFSCCMAMCCSKSKAACGCGPECHCSDKKPDMK